MEGQLYAENHSADDFDFDVRLTARAEDPGDTDLPAITNPCTTLTASTCNHTTLHLCC